jgi:membrane protein
MFQPFRTMRRIADKRYTTLAGTLVYFLLMSITPFLLWISLVVGKRDWQLDVLLNLSVFNGVRPFFSLIKQAAVEAAEEAGFTLLVVSLWSSTNFLYHLRRSGEIIYESKRTKGGIKLRIVSILLILAVLLLFGVLAAVVVLAQSLPPLFPHKGLADGFLLAVAVLVAFFLCVGLNLFLCPYKIKFSEVVAGSLFTLLWWIVFCIGFGVYANFANPERLYGKIASLFVFLLWCYFMMSGFVAGAIYNAMFKVEKTHKTHL